MSNLWHEWLTAAHTMLKQREQHINAMNVFPVPDSDTGTNLCITLKAALTTDSPAESAQLAMMDARGNSGTLVSIWLVQVASAFEKAKPEVALYSVLKTAAETVRAALVRPEEGTALSVMDAISSAADPRTLVDQASTAVSATPGQLAALKGTGFVDAGALGFLYIVDALATVLGNPSVAYQLDKRFLLPAGTGSVRTQHSAEVTTAGSEIMVNFQADLATMSSVRSQLETMGDSLSIALVDGEAEPKIWAIHIHVVDTVPIRTLLENAGTLSNWRTTAL